MGRPRAAAMRAATCSMSVVAEGSFKSRRRRSHECLIDRFIRPPGAASSDPRQVIEYALVRCDLSLLVRFGFRGLLPSDLLHHAGHGSATFWGEFGDVQRQ